MASLKQTQYAREAYADDSAKSTYGGSIKEAGVDGHLIQPTELQGLARKK